MKEAADAMAIFCRLKPIPGTGLWKMEAEAAEASSRTRTRGYPSTTAVYFAGFSGGRAYRKIAQVCKSPLACSLMVRISSDGVRIERAPS